MKRTVRTPDGHLLWTGGLANGYPAAKHEGKTVYLKRLVWEQENGLIPEGAVVISTCGKRTCIELSHLALSTPGRYASVRDALGRYRPAREEGARAHESGSGNGHAHVADEELGRAMRTAADKS